MDTDTTLLRKRAHSGSQGETGKEASALPMAEGDILYCISKADRAGRFYRTAPADEFIFNSFLVLP